MFLQGWTELGISFRYLKIKFQKLLGVAHFAKMRHPYALTSTTPSPLLDTTTIQALATTPHSAAVAVAAAQ